MTVGEFFKGFEAARPLFEAVQLQITALGDVGLQVTRSQIAFRRRIVFAWVWVPDRYLSGGHAPLVLSIALRRRDASPRWKQVVEPTPGRFMHHLEVYVVSEIDDEVQRWLHEGWSLAK